MNRVILGVVVLLLILGAIIYIARGLFRTNLRQLLPNQLPKPGASEMRLTSPSLLPQPSTESNLLPKSGVLPATGL